MFWIIDYIFQLLVAALKPLSTIFEHCHFRVAFRTTVYVYTRIWKHSWAYIKLAKQYFPIAAISVYGEKGSGFAGGGDTLIDLRYCIQVSFCHESELVAVGARRCVSFLDAKSADATRSVCVGSVGFWNSIFSISVFSNSSLIGPVQYGVELADCLVFLPSSIRCFAMLMQPMCLSHIDWSFINLGIKISQCAHYFSGRWASCCQFCSKSKEPSFWITIWRNSCDCLSSVVRQCATESFERRVVELSVEIFPTSKITTGETFWPKKTTACTTSGEVMYCATLMHLTVERP